MSPGPYVAVNVASLAPMVTVDVLARLLTFPNVLITGHQGFFTQEALDAIARTTLSNVRDLETAGQSPNEVTRELVQRK